MGCIRYDLEPQGQNGPIVPLYVSVSAYDHTWHSIIHTHSNAELFYCVSGEGCFRVENEKIPVHADDLIVVNPHVEHTEYSIGQKGLEYIVLGVQGVEFFSVSGESVGYRTMNYTENRRELLPYFHDIVNEADRKNDDYAEVCQHILQILLLKLKRHKRFDVECVTPERFATTDCVMVKRYIDDHFSEIISLDQLVEHTHLSKFYLAHSFQKEFGVSPMNYLTQRRIREARHLLTHTDHSLSQICHVLGFSSQSYFSQCFRRVTGQSPSGYRKRSRLEETAGEKE